MFALPLPLTFAVASRADAWIETALNGQIITNGRSRPARTRGLKQGKDDPGGAFSQSRPARTRGLKLQAARACGDGQPSRPARTRGLKLCRVKEEGLWKVASRADAWIETLS